MHEARSHNTASPVVDTNAVTVSSRPVGSVAAISQEEIFEVEEAWANGVVEIGSLFLTDGDYIARTHSFIETLYGYAEGPVLFKPTLAVKKPFRTDQTEAISYFIGGVIDEDLGFAIRPWQGICFGEQHIVLQGATALAMGHYFFTENTLKPAVKAEFTLGFIRQGHGALKINLHHSSLPHPLPV